MLSSHFIANKLPKRPEDAHKGVFGKVMVIAGSENYPGAAYLACLGSLRVGAGLVCLVSEKNVCQSVASKTSEVIYSPLSESNYDLLKEMQNYQVIVLGPGLGKEQEQKNLVSSFINSLKKEKRENIKGVVVDADGLNILSEIPEWWSGLESYNFCLTPHLGEMSRLTKLSIDELKKDKEKIVKDFNLKWKQTLVLKGANSLIFSKENNLETSPFSNSTLATAGTGDVLAGEIGGFMAQGLDGFEGACCGVYIQGLAAQLLNEDGIEAGATSSDILKYLPKAIYSLKRDFI